MHSGKRELFDLLMSSIRIFNCSIRLFICSNVQLFNSIVHLFDCSIIQFECSFARMFKCSIIQFDCSNVHLFECSFSPLPFPSQPRLKYIIRFGCSFNRTVIIVNRNTYTDIKIKRQVVLSIENKITSPSS